MVKSLQGEIQTMILGHPEASTRLGALDGAKLAKPLQICAYTASKGLEARKEEEEEVFDFSPQSPLWQNFEQKETGTQTCIHQNIVQRSKFEKTDLPTSELGTTC